MLDKITNISKITLNEDDVLLVSVDRGQIPQQAWEKYTVELRDALKVYFLSNKIIIADKDTTFTIIEQTKKELK